MALSAFTVANDDVVLRPFEASDLPLIKEAAADPFIPLITTVPADYTDAAGMAYIERQGDRLLSDTGWSLAIVDARTDEPVGQVGFWVTNLHKGRAEIGYWVAGSGRGRGLASKAVELLTQWAFAQTDVQRLALYIEPWNVASIRTAENSGYRREGLLRSWELVDGEPRNMWSYVRRRSGTPSGQPDVAELIDLEADMWRVSTRASTAWMDEHLAPEFTEFGRSGRAYSRQDILEAEIGDIDAEPLADVQVRQLDDDCALVTYRSIVRGDVSNRASVWNRASGRWLLEFHQGTPTTAG